MFKIIELETRVRDGLLAKYLNYFYTLDLYYFLDIVFFPLIDSLIDKISYSGVLTEKLWHSLFSSCLSKTVNKKISEAYFFSSLTFSYMDVKASRENPIYKTGSTALICFASCTYSIGL